MMESIFERCQNDKMTSTMTIWPRNEKKNAAVFLAALAWLVSRTIAETERDGRIKTKTNADVSCLIGKGQMDDEIKNTRIKTGLNSSLTGGTEIVFRSEKNGTACEEKGGKGRGTPGRIRSPKFRKRPRAEIKPRLFPFEIHK